MRLKWPSNEQILYAANILANKFFFKQKPESAPQSILIVKWDEIGDMATCTHVFKDLKMAFPQAEISLLCKTFVKNLVENDPHLDHIITDIKDYHKPYELVVELRGTWSTLLTSFRYKSIYRVSRAETRLKNKGKQLHEIDTNFDIIRPLLPGYVKSQNPQLYYSQSDVTIVNEWIALNKIQKFAVLHAGARKKLRQWNLDRFALAAEYLHHTYGFEIVFAGAKEDQKDITIINSYLNFQTFDFTTGFSLSQFSYLCSLADFYLGNESGPMHIASAFNRPLIGLFGPGVPDVFYPRSDRAKVLHHVLSCNPCDQIHCVHPENPCISRIQAVDVLEKIDEILHE